MRKAILMGAVLMLCSALALAQDTNTSSAADTSSAASNTVQGCLSGTSGNYMLTDATGAMYQLQGDESQLSANVNKEVEVTGTAGAKASASATSPDANAPGSAASGAESGAPSSSTGSTGSSTGTAAGASASASAGKTLAVTSIRKVADSCTSSK